MLSRSVLSVLLPRENKPKNGGICVANHTTPIDVIILANDGCYSLVDNFLFFCFYLFCAKYFSEYLMCFFFLKGGPGASRAVGDGAAGHGQVHASHLVREIPSQRQTSGGQKVMENLCQLLIFVLI